MFCLSCCPLGCISRTQPLPLGILSIGYISCNIAIGYLLLQFSFLWLILFRQLQLNLSVKCCQFRLQAFQFIFFLPLFACNLFQEWNVLGKYSVLLFILLDGLKKDSCEFFDERSGKAERMKFKAACMGIKLTAPSFKQQLPGRNYFNLLTII